MAELADATDLGSVARKGVGVQVPPFAIGFWAVQRDGRLRPDAVSVQFTLWCYAIEPSEHSFACEIGLQNHMDHEST